METKDQVKVIKADGSVEAYLHTKVLGTISFAMCGAGHEDISTAEQLAEAVTYFLYRDQERDEVSSGEIFSIIKAVLTATGYEEAAEYLTDRHYGRKLKRSRIEVVSVNLEELADADALLAGDESAGRSRWNKTVIVEDLVAKYDMERHAARAVASMVEEKIFGMGVTVVPASLIKQLVLSDAAVVMRAHRELAAA
jgi:hypothetical protein